MSKSKKVPPAPRKQNQTKFHATESTEQSHRKSVNRQIPNSAHPVTPKQKGK